MAAAVLVVGALIALTGLPRPRSFHFDNISIRGSPRFQGQVVSALALLRTKSPDGYQIITNNIGAITQSKHSGMAAYRKPPTFELNDQTAFYSVTWCAGSIAHDSIHSKLYLDYLKRNARMNVPTNIWIGEAAEKVCSEHQVRVLIQIGAPSNEITHCIWNPADRYWEVDYQKRNW